MEPLCNPNSVLDLSSYFNKVHSLRGLHGQIKQLEEKLQDLEESLKDAEAGRGRNTSSQQISITELRKAVFDVQDFIEVYRLVREYENKAGFVSKLASKMEMASQIAPLMNEVKKIIASTTKDQRTSGIEYMMEKAATCGNDQMPYRQSIPAGREKFIVGLEAETQKLVSELILGKNTSLSSVSIVGMGGIGKTTLASKVYNDPTIVAHFKCRLWIPATQQFNYRDVLIMVLMMKPGGTQMSKPPDDLTDRNLVAMVRKSLRGKRYLAVFDDVWSQEAWDQLKSAFPDTKSGSRLIVTTRNSGLRMGTPDICHQMKTLTMEQSRKLFLQKVSIGEGDADHLFGDILIKLLEQCDGLPLAIVVIGGALKKERRKEQWEKVYHGLMSQQGALVRGILKVLALSYETLSAGTRSCFLRISFFPKDWVISTRDLIYLWAAHSLLSEDDDPGMVNIGKTHLNKLIRRNMVEVVSMSSDGATVKTCRVHPLMRSLSALKAKEEIFFQTRASSEIRHKAIYSDSLSTEKGSLSMERGSSSMERSGNFPHLHSLLDFQPEVKVSYKQLSSVCLYSKLLKVLYLEGRNISELPDAIGFLRNLRYLNLRRNQITHLPQSMKFLLRLSTLDVRKNPGLKDLSIVKRLEKLRNLHLDDSPEQLGVESSCHLRTLGWVSTLHIHKYDIGNLKELENLKVTITGNSRGEETLKSLASLERLESLKLNIKDYQPCLSSSAEIFSNMHNLRTLHLKGWMTDLVCPDVSTAFRVPFQELQRLPKLAILKLQCISTTEDELLISTGDFPQLVYLELSNIGNLKWFRVLRGQGGEPGEVMPKLKRLVISACQSMKVVPQAFKHFRALEVFQFHL